MAGLNELFNLYWRRIITSAPWPMAIDHREKSEEKGVAALDLNRHGGQIGDKKKGVAGWLTPSIFCGAKTGLEPAYTVPR
jgi:hypothetical protein